MTEEDYKKKFPIGSKWKTRGGNIATIIYHNDDDTNWPLIALVKNINRPATYTKSGYFNLNTSNHEFDLIEPYVEPKRGVGYLNVYEDGNISSDLHQTRLGADKRADEGRIACIRVEWKEGQYDE